MLVYISKAKDPSNWELIGETTEPARCRLIYEKAGYAVSILRSDEVSAFQEKYRCDDRFADQLVDTKQVSDLPKKR